MAPNLTQKAQTLATKLAAFPEVQEIVQASHSAMPTTQYDYAGWASRIDALATALATEPGTPSTNLRIMAAEALRIAGGNGLGIDAAMSSLFGVAGYDLQASLMGIG